MILFRLRIVGIGGLSYNRPCVLRDNKYDGNGKTSQYFGCSGDVISSSGQGSCTRSSRGFLNSNCGSIVVGGGRGGGGIGEEEGEEEHVDKKGEHQQPQQQLQCKYYIIVLVVQILHDSTCSANTTLQQVYCKYYIIVGVLQILHYCSCSANTIYSSCQLSNESVVAIYIICKQQITCDLDIIWFKCSCCSV